MRLCDVMVKKLIVLLIATSSLLSLPSAIALPSPLEVELKAATRVGFGKPISIAIPDCKLVVKNKKYSTQCKFEKFVVTVNSFKFVKRTTPIDVEVSVYAIDLNMENYSKNIDSGLDVGALLRCKNERTYSPFYSDGIDPQDVPAGSEVSGVVFASLPDDLDEESCQIPTLWISLFGAGVDMKDKAVVAEAKKKKLISRAYIPLTKAMLSGN